ncbi:MAG: mechanosensitive ion channel family protein [Candidatus Aquilonibacter sp.]
MPVACIVVAAGVGAVLEFIVQRRVATSGLVRRHPWLAILIDALDAGILFWATALGVHIALAVSSLPDNVRRLLDETLLVLVCVSVTVVAARFVGNAVLRMSRGPGQQIASGSLFASVSQALIIVLGGLFTLSALGVEVTPLLTALGVGGLAVALALQPPLANLFSGIQLVASRQIRPGDYIALPSGQQGFVEDINWRSISIRESTNSLVVVPNTVLAGEVFTNYRLPEPRVAARVPLRVAYGSDLAFVERLAHEAVALVGEDIKDPGAMTDAFVRVHEFAETTVNLSVSFFVRRAIDQEQARSEFLRCFYELIRRDNIGSPIINPVVPQERVVKGAVSGKV